MSDITDPIEGLVRYVNEIKPFHTKIVELLTEYVYSENVNVILTESLLIDIGIISGGASDAELATATSSFGSVYRGTYGTDTECGILNPYDSARYYPVIAVNSGLSDGAFHNGFFVADKRGYDFTNKRISIPGDQSATYRSGRTVVVELIRHSNITGEETVVERVDNFEILSSTYIADGQTNGISDTPRTELVLSDLIDDSQFSFDSNSESWAASVTVNPDPILNVVTTTPQNSNTDRINHSTIPLLGPPVPESFVSTLTADIVTFANYIELDGDVSLTYDYGSTILVRLLDGTEQRYTISSSIFNGTTTILEILENLPDDLDYIGSVISESFYGYSEEYIQPSAAEGFTRAHIAESLSISFNDGTNEIFDFVQFLINHTEPGNVIILASDGRDPLEFMAVGDTINIAGQLPENNQQWIISALNASSAGFEVTVSGGSLTPSTNTGFLETT